MKGSRFRRMWPSIPMAATQVPAHSAALLPLGGINYGYKGAALASMVEVLSAVMTGMPHCSRLLGMAGPDFATHRHLGHFFIVIDPRRFVSSEAYNHAMDAYLGDLRAMTGRKDMMVMAPGDREWAVEEDRQLYGIPVADQLKIDLDQLADSLGVGARLSICSPGEPLRRKRELVKHKRRGVEFSGITG